METGSAGRGLGCAGSRGVGTGGKSLGSTQVEIRWETPAWSFVLGGTASRKVPPPGRQVKAPYFSLPAEPPTQAPAPWGAGH